ncbi:lysM domain protein [Lactobacillus selangorensis]|uniref:LysM domain protein n=1 Tax=Lactobacillus selangorensis TaxID=81857 RepID=A0A0R2FLE2_9LACO|nr:LysM domain-containing protein [Lactobacillus selangorensis]KRN29441.1 lysM domain protein [Lactobacillus selangorensis]KRN34030.1 lysM domain protein [Lactobacillus selangorensis]
MNKDDKNKVDHSQDKPWENQFDDDRNDKGDLSRVASHKREKHNSVFVWILTIILIAMIAFPVIYYLANQSQVNKPSKSADSEVVVSSNNKKKAASRKAASKKRAASASESLKEAKAKSESKKKAAAAASASKQEAEAASNSAAVAQSQQEAAASSSEAAASSSEAAASSSAAAASSASAASSSSSSSASASSTSGDYVTVQSGQGLYRTAVNNGITLQQLLELNGLSADSTVAPGTQLRIK